MKAIAPYLFLILLSFRVNAQDTADLEALSREVELSEVVVRSDLNVPAFLRRIRDDSSYFKAFRNLRILQFSAYNNIRMLNKRGDTRASLESRTRQNRAEGCRTMDVLEEKTTGDFYNRKQEYNYYTAELFAAFFFTTGKVCGENNTVKDLSLNVGKNRGLRKNAQQLKMLFFNPGKKIPGIPFIGDKLDVFGKEITNLYDYAIDTTERYGSMAYVFSIKRKEGLSSSDRDRIVFDNITTTFDAKTMEVMHRIYHMSYDAGLYDFDVQMEVEMQRVGALTVPHVLRYNGNWFLLTKSRERGQFTAVLSDFKQ